MTFLTIYTPTYKRPRKLERCKASVAMQREQDYQHLIIEDTVGLGVAGMFQDIPAHHAEIQGDYVYFLSDDDVLVDEGIVGELKQFVEDTGSPDVVMARVTIGTSMLPGVWMSEPREGAVTLSNWIVKREVWEAVPYGNRYEGDADFIIECWRRKYRFAWWDRYICHAEGWGRGQPE